MLEVHPLACGDLPRLCISSQRFIFVQIYSNSDEVNSVQKDIRNGHQVTIDTALSWLSESQRGKTLCDLGCGVGSLAIPMAQRGARVSASDISSAMAKEARRRAKAAGLDLSKVKFIASDLESITGKFDTVTCIDVMIHYPAEKMRGMVSHLAGLSNDKLIISFAPKVSLGGLVVVGGRSCIMQVSPRQRKQQ
jgi:magnesium-protoporphyrin O-methyltransferase